MSCVQNQCDYFLYNIHFEISKKELLHINKMVGILLFLGTLVFVHARKTLTINMVLLKSF